MAVDPRIRARGSRPAGGLHRHGRNEPLSHRELQRLVWTVGHSTRSADELIGLLTEHAIDTLLDVRTLPRSRRSPQFNADQLPATLCGPGIRYRHDTRLGGLRKPQRDSINTAWNNPGFRGYADHMQTPEFAEAISELRALASSGRVAVMCAEAVPWRCHRTLIADALTVRGFDVRHILGPGNAKAHALTPWARPDGERLIYPGVLESG